MGEKKADRWAHSLPPVNFCSCFSWAQQTYLRLSDVCQLLLISLQAYRGYGLTWSDANLQSII